jgi:DNA-binding transcriptional MerR regulator
VTVRALYHYDEIGLLRASERTASGHRRYTEADLHQLYRVRALRALGMPLDEIRDAVAGPPGDLVSMRALLRAQLRELGEQAARIQRLSEQVQDLLRLLDQASMPDPALFTATLEMISVLDSYFTQDHQDQLARRRAELGPEAVREAQTRWSGLVSDLLALMQAGTAASDPRTQDLARQWDELAAEFHPEPGGEQTRRAARQMWQEHSEELSQRLPWPADQMAGLVSYLEQARQAR